MRTGDKVKITDSESGVCFGVVISHGPKSFVVDWGDVTCSYANDDERVCKRMEGWGSMPRRFVVQVSIALTPESGVADAISAVQHSLTRSGYESAIVSEAK